MKQTTGSKMFARDQAFYPLCIVLALSAVLLRWLALPFQSHDVQDYLLYWFDHIVSHGGIAALSDNFNSYTPIYNYTPPYLYLMTAVTYLDGMIDRVTLIKSISILFDCVTAIFVYRIVLLVRQDARRAMVSALLFLNVPTVLLDGALWGQFDVVYSSFIVAFAYYILSNRPLLAVMAYAFAFSVKFQTIFLAPFLVYLLFIGIIPLVSVIVFPVIYALLMLPAALAGHSWVDLLTVYAKQVGFMHALSANAPNVYIFFQGLLSEQARSYFAYGGVAVAALASFAILLSHFRRRPPLPAVFVIVSITLWLGIEPSLLPRMHERYFLPADILAFLFACLVPRAWWIAALFQVGSVLAYAPYLASSVPGWPIDMTYVTHVGAVAMIAAMVGVVGFYLPFVKAGMLSKAV